MNKKEEMTNRVESLNLSVNGSVINQNIESNNKNDDVEDMKLSATEVSWVTKMLREEPTSPFHSDKTFEELNLRPELLKGLYAMGFSLPSKIQETALSILLADPPQNMIAQSQSGTGKTAAFVLAMLSRVNPNENYPQVLCLSPTDELARQTGNVIKQMAKFCENIKIRHAVRGEEIDFAVEQGCTLMPSLISPRFTEQIVIGTPQKVFDMGCKFKYFDLKKIRVFVLDEANVMIGIQGRRHQSIRIHTYLSADCQMMSFSATYDHDVMEFAEVIIKNPVIIRLPRQEESLENIKQYYVRCENVDERYTALSHIYGAIPIDQAIIFCHTRTAAWVMGKIYRDGYAVALLSEDLTVKQRIAILDRFREGFVKILITTNVFAIGIDVKKVTMVVNFDDTVDSYDRPDFKTYLWRIGRTGRFGKPGIAINMVEGKRSMGILKQIEEHFGRPILQVNAYDVDELDKIAQD